MFPDVTHAVIQIFFVISFYYCRDLAYCVMLTKKRILTNEVVGCK